MIIHKINIKNFKGFEQKEIPLNEHFTIAVGSNASGKTTLLKALEISLGEYLQCLPLPKGESIHKRQFSQSDRFVKWSTELLDYLPKEENPKIEVNGSFLGKQIEWTREMVGRITTHNTKLAGKLIKAVDELIAKRKKGENVIMPIVATYGIERTVSQLRKGKVKSKMRSRMEKAFLGALKDTVDFEGVIDWLHDYDNELKYNREFIGTREALFEAIQKAIPYLEDISYNTRYEQLEAVVNVEEKYHGKKLHNNMSDGFKAMLNIVAELAYRCVVLNGFKGKDAVKETPGVVLIDELDMHLHPNWQRHVVDDLKNAFPKIQFIATTHSPFITQSLSADGIINLDEPKDIDPSKMRVDEVATSVMGVDSAYSKDNEELYQKAKVILKSIKENASPDEIKEEINKVHDPAVRAFLELNKMANGK
ncbi:MAG TPA: AAA family ATPase [Bacteroidia bacterium]|jgi:predicted ATP-binding protein involved in virulence|nr:AAA family ATPase [Bacteroidia bacterium]HRG53454.1 AAA family ATPase [Bacteroidia bacterium]